jgi:hypothetical protein
MKKLFRKVIDFSKQYLPIRIAKEDKIFLLVFVLVLLVSISLTYYVSEFLK